MIAYPPIMEIRDVAAIEEFRACEALQKAAFGYEDLDVVPKNELISIARSGGIVLGAFEGARLAGFVFGFLGRDGASGALYHSSRMVAVDPERRGRGIASALKMAQRERALAQGIAAMRWTFDPLAVANAHLNLRKLGAVATGYARDYYGPTRAGRPTDRLLVTWRLDRPRREAPPGAERIAVPAPIEEVRARFEDAFARGLEALDFQEGAYLLG
jgi:predicted GNAT superfamily acetyltransferase